MPPSTQPSSTGPSFEVRIRMVLLILLSGLLIVATGGVLSALALADAASDVDTVERATAALGGVLEGMVDQETGVRGFILTGQEPFLETYGPGGAKADSNRSFLDELVGDLDGFESFAQLDQAIAAWRDIADEEIRLVRSGRTGDAVAIVESGAAKERFDLVRTYIQSIDDRLTDAIATRNSRQEDLTRLLAGIGVAVLVGAIAIIAATVRWLRRSVTQPLAILAGAVGESATEPFTDLAGDAAGEVAALARSADRLRVTKDIERNEAVLVAEQNERARVAADLHDGPVQSLFALQLRMQQLIKRHHDDPDVADVVGDGIDVLESTQADLRHLMFDLAPPGLGDRPLAHVIEATVSQVLEPPTRAIVDVPEDADFGSVAQLVICRVIVEAVRNVNRHAAAATVTIRVVRDGDVATVDVVDDGAGFAADEAPASGHFGLGIMRSLVESIGGVFSVTTVPGAGTTVHFEVPA